MTHLSCKTHGNADPHGKPKVYFTCHPSDYARSLDIVCRDLFAAHDCAVYYTSDMGGTLEDRDLLLGSMSLFVIPVSEVLLTSPNRAMDADFPFAQAAHIPVLPILLEPGLDALYSQADKFGDLQYLNPNSQDDTEISYPEKLHKYLQAVLLSDDVAQQIRDAFDAYIFLSYRKKDRLHANELMRLIHARVQCRDIAIWYDEFLTPGESFRDNIARILKRSKLFALLVTPNLLEEPDGKPNFVMGQEYPFAKEAGMDMLCVEMVETDKHQLKEKFQGIPDCVDPRIDHQFTQQLLDTAERIAVSANNDDPAHNYLIGLAYLEGIDMEVDRQRALQLITSAAEAELPEAMQKLYHMYKHGIGTGRNYEQAFVWADKLARKYSDTLGKTHPQTLSALNNLAIAYADVGNLSQAHTIKEQVYTLRCQSLGKAHPDTLRSLKLLSGSYRALGNLQAALALARDAYDLCCEHLGPTHPDTLNAQNSLALNLCQAGQHREALQLQQDLYKVQIHLLGELHPHTLTTLENQAATYREMGNRRQTAAILEDVATKRTDTLGAQHPDTLRALDALCTNYEALAEYPAAARSYEQLYDAYCQLLGSTAKRTMSTLYRLTEAYRLAKDMAGVTRCFQRVYDYHCATLGKDHPKTQALGKKLDSAKKQYPI